MPRPARIEYAGAVYHVLNRGNYRQDLSSDRKLAPWKVVLAGWIKRHCAVSNRWWSETLHLGNSDGISKAITQETKAKHHARLWQLLETPKSKA